MCERKQWIACSRAFLLYNALIPRSFDSLILIQSIHSITCNRIRSLGHKIGPSSTTSWWKVIPTQTTRSPSRSRGKKKTDSHLFHTEQQEHPELPHQHNFQAHHGMHHGVDNVHHFTHMAQRQGSPRFHLAEQFSMHILPDESFKTSYVLPVQVRAKAIFLSSLVLVV